MEPVTTTATATGSSKIIMAIVGILLVGGIAWGVASRGGDESASTGDTNDSSSDESTFSGSIFDLVGRGGEQKCTWTMSADGFDGEGTVYVADGKFASEVTGSANGTTFTAHAIGDGEFLYSWTDMAPFGMKMSLAKAQEMSAQATAEVEAQGGTPDVATGDVSANYNYDCDSWNADEATFVVPTTVTFSEFNY